MQLKKLSDNHYVVVSDEPIKEGDWFIRLDTNLIFSTLKNANLNIIKKYCKKITHSTQPLNTKFNDWFDVQILDLSTCKSLVGEVDVEKKIQEKYPESNAFDDIAEYEDPCYSKREGARWGYNECLEDNKHKRFSEEDLRKELASLALEIATEDGELKSCSPSLIYSWIEKRIKSLTQPKNTWECEFIDRRKLKLK